MMVAVGGSAVSYGVYSGVLYDSYQYCMIMVVREAYGLSTWEIRASSKHPNSKCKCIL
jgi:hypothetical protein